MERMEPITSNTVNEIKQLYKRVSNYPMQIASSDCASHKQVHLTNASALVDFVNKHPLRANSDDDDTVIASFAAHYKSILANYYNEMIVWGQDFGIDCLTHIQVNAPNAQAILTDMAIHISDSHTFSGIAICASANSDENIGDMFYLASSHFAYRLEKDLAKMGKLFTGRHIEHDKVSAWRYFVPLMVEGDESLDPPITRVNKFVNQSISAGVDDVSGIASLIGQVTTYVHDYTKGLDHAIEDTMRYMAHLETERDFVRNPLIVNRVYGK